jgi:XTP/dITP diphosphohydrolase
MTIILATRNRHKAGEIGAILNVPVRALSDLPEAPELVENADNFAGNATQKAVQLARWLVDHPEVMAVLPTPSAPGVPGQTRPGCFVLADDSGLEVDFLHGAPGVYSARFAAMDVSGSNNSTDAENNAKLLRLLQDTRLEERTARFRCVLALIDLTSASPLPATELFEGACEGRISLQPSGTGGFGYDPLFVPEGFNESFAELGEEVKNRISHRARALARLREWLTAR